MAEQGETGCIGAERAGMTVTWQNRAERVNGVEWVRAGQTIPKMGPDLAEMLYFNLKTKI